MSSQIKKNSPQRVGVFCFALTLSTMTWLVGCSHRSAHVVLEQPPCQSCAGIYSSNGPIPTVEFCEFAAHPGLYSNGLVRLRAEFANDASQTILRPPQGQCQEPMLAIRTGLDKHCAACDGARKALSIYSGFETWYDSHALVVVVGRMGVIKNPKSYYNGEPGFNISCLESVQPIGSGEMERQEYERWFPF